MPPELQTLDQLLGGEMRLSEIRGLYSDDAVFTRSIHSLLQSGDVRLFSSDGTDVPQRRWRELFSDGGIVREIPELILELTEQGARRIK